jgi:Protein of unknown function, DUF547
MRHFADTTRRQLFGLTRTSHLVAVLAACGVMLGTQAHAKTPLEAFSAHEKGSTQAVDHAAWDKLLKTYVVPGPDGINRVNYKAFKADGHAALKGYVKALEAVEPAKLDRPEQFAYWANLYNAKTIDIVLDKYPVKSIKDISLGGGLLAAVTGGPWKAKVLKVGGMDISLDDIEHGLMRPLFKDPRVHYAVNCASFGCPNLGTDAFTGAKLNEQLDGAARAFVNNSRGVAVENGEVTVSSIYSWFQVDFGGSDEGVLAHIAAHASDELKSKLKGITEIGDTQYDWALNESK